MLFVHPWRRPRLAAVAAGALASTLVAVLLPTAAHAAALTGTVVVTSPSNAKLAALTAKQVAVLTVSGAGVPALSEDNVASIGLGSTCNALTGYVVTSATVVTVKTTNLCPAGAGDILITFANGDTLTKTNGITFVSPPVIEALANNPVINDNSVFSATANQQHRLGTGGGQIVRVRADPAYAFSPATVSALSASVGGKAGTLVKVYNDSIGTPGSTAIAVGTAGVVGNSMSFTTASGMTAGESTITLSQDGVAKSFLTAVTGLTVVAAPTVTTLSVQSGRANATNVSTVISGTNFPKVLSDAIDATKWTVNFCGVAATVTAASTTGLTLTVTVPDVAGVALGLGATTYAGVCPVVVTDVIGSQSSPITVGSNYAVVNE